MATPGMATPGMYREKDSTGALKYGTEDTDGTGKAGDDEGEDTG